MSDFVQYAEKLGKTILYMPTAKISVNEIKSKRIVKLIETMKEKMAGVGIGLAANQVGEGIQLFMLEFSPVASDDAYTDRYDLQFPPVPFQIFINPKITKVSEDSIAFWHGCLSAQNKPMGLVATYRWLEYEALNEYGEKISGKMDAMGAVIFQHEFRHLLGSLYIDHAKLFLDYHELQAKFASGELQSYSPADESVPHLLSDYQIGESIDEYAARLKKR